MMTASRKTQD